MPVRYEAPQPFAPSIAEGYGRSEVIQRMTPQVYGAASDTARMRMQAASDAADRAERSAARRQASSDNQMALLQRQTEANYGNLQRAAIADADIDQRAYEFEGERQLRTNALEFQRAQAQAEMQARQNEIRQRAELENWQNQQALTFKEQQELRRMQAAVSEVDALPLTDDQKAEMKFRIKTGIDPLERRQRAAQTRQMEQHAQLFEQQANLQGEVLRKQAEFDSRAQYRNVEYVIDPGLQAELERTLPPPTPADVARYGGDAAEARRHQVAGAAYAKGGLFSIRERTGIGPNGLPTYQRSEVKRPESAGIDERQAAEAGAAATKTVNDMVAARAKAELPLDDWMKTPEGIAGKAVEVARASALAARAYADTLAGRPSQGQGGGAEAFKSANPMDWKDGFDANNPPPGKPAEWVARNRQRMQEIQNDSRYYQPQKDPVLAARRRREEIAAKPNKTPEDVAEFNRLGKVELPDLPAAGAQPASRPVFTPQALSMRGGF